MNWIVGVDEVGRGPLAGPVAVGVVVIPSSFRVIEAIQGLNDSKKLSEKKRQQIFDQVQSLLDTITYSVKFRSAYDIDSTGIVPSIQSAMNEALEDLSIIPEDAMVYLDGGLRAPVYFRQETVIGGDAKIPAIMLASVLAKVSRDKLMIELAREYPQYALDQNKGYGTKAHIEAIVAEGLSDIHRKSFCRNICVGGDL